MATESLLSEVRLFSSKSIDKQCNHGHSIGRTDHYHIQYISMVEIHISRLVMVSMSLDLGGTNERNSDGTFESNSAPKPTQHIHLFHRQVNDYYHHHYFLLHHYHHHQHDH